MLKKIAILALGSSFALSAFAAGGDALESSVKLKDGNTVHVFKDGRMGMESAYGRAFVMDEGHVMQAQDGSKITMKGNEVWRVEALNGLYRGS